MKHATMKRLLLALLAAAALAPMPAVGTERRADDRISIRRIR